MKECTAPAASLGFIFWQNWTAPEVESTCGWFQFWETCVRFARESVHGVQKYWPVAWSLKNAFMSNFSPHLSWRAWMQTLNLEKYTNFDSNIAESVGWELERIHTCKQSMIPSSHVVIVILVESISDLEKKTFSRRRRLKGWMRTSRRSESYSNNFDKISSVRIEQMLHAHEQLVIRNKRCSATPKKWFSKTNDGKCCQIVLGAARMTNINE
jgi:hypothetical protein